MHSIDSLKSVDGLREGFAGSLPVYLHEDHRWLLPIMFAAQERALLPRPCTVVMFDAHDDALIPGHIEEVRHLAGTGVTMDGLLELCAKALRSIDDDWVVSGMELGIIKHCVAFGVEHSSRLPRNTPYTDGRGVKHTLWSTSSLPGGEMGKQGDLSDCGRSKELQPLWDALGWESVEWIFGFTDATEKIVVDIDLDCFSTKYRDVTFSWPDKVFESEFERVSEYPATEGWSGRRFFEGLLDRAGIVTIAREHGCCGGQEICNENLAKVSRYMFGSVGGLRFPHP